jgi:sec-independent protein translocase protein TatB
VLGFSFSEVILIGIVALVAVGPQRLPGMLKNFGMWMRKLRKLTTDVRAQTGIDDLLRAEGIHGGITELRTLMRGGAPTPAAAPYRPYDDPYRQLDVDLSREYPPEGADAKGALPDDLTGDEEDEDDAPVITVTADHTPPEPPPDAASPPAADAASPPAADAASPPPADPAPAADAASPPAADAASPPPADPAPAADAASPPDPTGKSTSEAQP